MLLSPLETTTAQTGRRIIGMRCGRHSPKHMSTDAMVKDFYERLDKAAEEKIPQFTTGKLSPNRGRVEKCRGLIRNWSEHTMHTGD